MVVRGYRQALLISLCVAAAPTTGRAASILFVGNSFTYGEPAGGPPTVQRYKPNTVTDLNVTGGGTGIGGVPALFKQLTVEAGLNFTVSLETVGGTGLDYHYNNKLELLTTQGYDSVILQGYSTLDPARPGDPTNQVKYSDLLAQAFDAKNPNTRVFLDATWSRADQTYLPSGYWYGQPISAMYLDVQAGDVLADNSSNRVDGVIPVGAAFNQAIQTGFADANPYDGLSLGTINIWAPDSYHASTFGYYLEALTEFYSVTGISPTIFGANDALAADIGITPAQALRLQAFAAASPLLVPEPGSALALGAGLAGLAWLRRRRLFRRA